MTALVPISDLFEVVYGANLELYKFTLCEPTDPESIRFVSRKKDNNGVSAFVKRTPDINPNPARTISIAGGGTYVLSAFLQSEPYYSGRDVYVLIPKWEMSDLELIYYCKCIYSNRYKYNYGRQANKTLRDLRIPRQMPVEFLDIDLRKVSEVNRASVDQSQIILQLENWDYFSLIDLFGITGTKTTPETRLSKYGEGLYPYVTTQETNNGVEGFYDFYTESGNVLTVDSAVMGYCSYQASPFSASDHVEKLVPKFTLNKYIAMFLVTVLNLEQYRYNYGRKCSQDRMRKIQIKLPAKDGQPDFDFMESFIKSLPFSASL